MSYQTQGAQSQGHEGNVTLWAHLLNIVSVVGPLIFWLATRDKSPNYDREGKEALNFGLTALIVSVAISIIAAVPLLGWLIAAIAGPLLWIAVIVFSILGAVQTSQTGSYRYPYTLRLIK